MIDEFAGQRLPDLPNAGYSTQREREVSDLMMEFIRQLERDRVVLLSIVVDGPEKWRKVAGGQWRGARMDDDVLNSIYGYLVLLAGVNPRAQLETLLQMRETQMLQQKWSPWRM
jgi:hypothetical protein